MGWESNNFWKFIFSFHLITWTETSIALTDTYSLLRVTYFLKIIFHFTCTETPISLTDIYSLLREPYFMEIFCHFTLSHAQKHLLHWQIPLICWENLIFWKYFFISGYHFHRNIYCTDRVNCLSSCLSLFVVTEWPMLATQTYYVCNLYSVLREPYFLSQLWATVMDSSKRKKSSLSIN